MCVWLVLLRGNSLVVDELKRVYHATYNSMKELKYSRPSVIRTPFIRTLANLNTIFWNYNDIHWNFAVD